MDINARGSSFQQGNPLWTLRLCFARTILMLENPLPQKLAGLSSRHPIETSSWDTPSPIWFGWRSHRPIVCFCGVLSSGSAPLLIFAILGLAEDRTVNDRGGLIQHAHFGSRVRFTKHCYLDASVPTCWQTCQVFHLLELPGPRCGSFGTFATLLREISTS